MTVDNRNINQKMSTLKKEHKALQLSCQLPQEVISYIFRFLHPIDIRSASLVCHIWAKASEDPLLWKNDTFVLFTKTETFSDYLLDSLKRRRIQHVLLRHTVTSNQVIQVCKRLAKNLTTISLEGCRCVNDTLVKILLKSCSNLTCINLGRCRQLDVSKKASWFDKFSSNFKFVTSLDLSCCKGLSDWTLSQIPLHFVHLENLGLSGCKEVSQRTWINLANKMTSLKSLDISRSDISDDILLKFSEVSILNLTAINLSACKQLTDNGIVSLVKNQTKLQHLKLSCLDISNTSLLAIGKYLNDLKSLDLNSCRQITDYALVSSTGLLNSLITINLYSCYQLTSKGIQQFFSSKDNSSFPLNTLILNGCSLATDGMIDKCCQVLHNLQELDISSCLHITNTGLNSITAYLTELKILKLSWCAKITDEGLLGVAEGGISAASACSLSRLESKAGISRLTKLSVLDVSHCTSLTDDGIESVHSLVNLKSLNLNMCIEVSVFLSNSEIK